jgi:hypothetical protein
MLLNSECATWDIQNDCVVVFNSHTNEEFIGMCLYEILQMAGPERVAKIIKELNETPHQLRNWPKPNDNV